MQDFFVSIEAILFERKSQLNGIWNVGVESKDVSECLVWAMMHRHLISKRARFFRDIPSVEDTKHESGGVMNTFFFRCIFP